MTYLIMTFLSLQFDREELVVKMQDEKRTVCEHIHNNF